MLSLVIKEIFFQAKCEGKEGKERLPEGKQRRADVSPDDSSIYDALIVEACFPLHVSLVFGCYSQMPLRRPSLDRAAKGSPSAR